MTLRTIRPDPLAGAQLMARLDTLAQYTEAPGEVTRTYLTPALRAAGARLIEWMGEAGLAADFDALGNVVGRRAGRSPKAPALLLGSHYDTVRNAGKYDGLYGVVAAIAAVADLTLRGVELPFPIEVVAFGDEEGVRFKSTLIGSRALAGTLDPAVLAAVDADGTSLADALHMFGGAPAHVKKLARRRDSVRGYLEAHIEQGPVLADRKIGAGIVTAIAGASRWQIGLRGVAGHAGTVPMDLRRDALAAAAEFVLAVETLARETPDLVATVGSLATPGGAANVIPGAVDLSLDVRSPSDAVRRRAGTALLQTLREGARRRGVKVAVTLTHEASAVACDSGLQAVLAASVEAHGLPVVRLASGAGHDAMAMAALCPVAMLFVRCGNGGISHDPRETMTAADAALGARILVGAVERLAAS